jgi:hypothetical protein
MKAEESDLITRKGKYPNGLTHVLVLARQKDVYGGGYKWTSGSPTGETGTHDEHFEVVTDSPLVEPEKAMYHKEDIKNPERSPSLDELNSNR